MEAIVNRTCDIRQVGLARNGQPRWWCRTHGGNAGGPGGTRHTLCEAVHTDEALASALTLKPTDYPGGVAVWAALDPILDTTGHPAEAGIHVHARFEVGSSKEIDRTFPAVAVECPTDLIGSRKLIINQAAATNFYFSRLLGQRLKYLSCSHCAEIHLDAGQFAIRAHRKHLCGSCGRYFWDTEEAVSNPITFVRAMLGNLDTGQQPIRAREKLDVRLADFPGGIQIWASNPAIFWTAPKPEEEGIHVHLFNDNRRQPVVDETFDEVSLNGIKLNEAMVRHLMAQQSLPYLAGKIEALKCTVCGEYHFDDGANGFEVHGEHLCEHCNAIFSSTGSASPVHQQSAYFNFEPTAVCCSRAITRGTMKGYVYITGTGTDPGLRANLNDPLFTKVPTLGGCMPNIRRFVTRGDWIFVVSGKVAGAQQYVVGGLRVAEKIDALSAYSRFPDNRLKAGTDGTILGNIIIQRNGMQHPLDTHSAATFESRIKNFIVGDRSIVLSAPAEIKTGREQTLKKLAEIVGKPGAIALSIRWVVALALMNHRLLYCLTGYRI